MGRGGSGKGARGVGSRGPAPKPAPKKAQTALQQLQGNSAEMQLRLGSVTHMFAMLNSFPLLFDVRWFVVNRIEFYLEVM